jgi:hypothetical protein
MNDGEIMNIIIKAIKLEASLKPNEKIYIGQKSYTYAEFANMLNNHRKLSKDGKQTVKAFLESCIKLFRENQDFREKIFSLAAGEG